LSNVTVLGINDGHNAGAALVRDGAVLAAIQEERIRNIKNYSGTPTESIKAVFDIAGAAPGDVALIAIVSLNRVYAPLAEMPFRVRLFEKLSPFLHSHAFSKYYVKVLHKFRPMKNLRRTFSEMGLLDKETVFIEHHSAHAALAYYQSPFSGETVALTLDGAGDGLSSTVNICMDSGIERVASSTYYDSPGNSFYSEITAYLGMKRWEHEYKIMGLAPYGKAEYCIKEMESIIRVNPRNPLEFQNTINACGTQIQGKLHKMLAGHRFDNIAAAAQLHFEGLMKKWVMNVVRKTGINRIACSGGSFLNVKANKVIREMEEVEDVFFTPICDDGGTPVGAALEGYHRYCERDGIKAKRIPIGNLYWGREFGEGDVREALERRGMSNKAEYFEDIESEIAKLLCKGKIVARFNGRDEFGPRALGNRSILGDPKNLGIIGRLNRAIKMRDFWMPFAPSILESRMKDYMVGARPARYMVEAFGTTEKAEEIIAGLHPYDRTARPQTVNDWNPDYRRILEEFEARTGVGGVLNTSFNLHGWPIVGSPETALDTFEKSGLDALAIGNYLILK
jgi:carbamoyltransferase